MIWLTQNLSDFQIGLLGFPLLLLFILLRIPVAVAMLVIGIVGKVIVEGRVNGANNLLKEQMFTDFNSYTLSLIPLFLLMSEFATKGGMSRALFRCRQGVFRSSQRGPSHGRYRCFR